MKYYVQAVNIVNMMFEQGEDVCLSKHRYIISADISKNCKDYKKQKFNIIMRNKKR